MNWQFKREETQFPQIPEGTYRCRIESAEMAVSKNGNDMLVLKLEVSGQTQRLWHYITFMNDKPEITNRLLTAMFDSFGIDEGDFNIAGYTGKAGACKVKHDEDGKARISYFLKKEKQSDLPAWKSAGDAGISSGNPFVEDTSEDIPFI